MVARAFRPNKVWIAYPGEVRIAVSITDMPSRCGFRFRGGRSHAAPSAAWGFSMEIGI